MKTLREVRSLAEEFGIGPYTHVVHERLVGSVVEPNLLISEDGEAYLACAVCYLETPRGVYSPVLNNFYSKSIYRYLEDAQAFARLYPDFVMVDPVTQTSFICLPTKGSR